MIMLLIARFYERFSGKRMYFRVFFAPLIFFGIAEVRYANVGKVIGDPFGDLAMAAAGIILIALCMVIYVQMLGPKSSHAPESSDPSDPQMDKPS